MSKIYHESASSAYRIQKRLSLNQCFREIYKDTRPPDQISYITFGGADLYDVMDLLAVFDVTKSKFFITSFERDEDVAASSKNCPVASTLSKINTVNILINPYEFPIGIEQLSSIRELNKFIYFLDYTGTYSEKDKDVLLDILNQGLLRKGDYLLVTSCLTPRIVHQPSFMKTHSSSFKLYFSTTEVDNEFVVRNHVDLLVAAALSEYDKTSRFNGNREFLRARLLRKFRYQDTRSPMGIWLFKLECRDTPTIVLEDVPLKDYPSAFEHHPIKREPIPNIFDDL